MLFFFELKAKAFRFVNKCLKISLHKSLHIEQEVSIFVMVYHLRTSIDLVTQINNKTGN